MDTLKLWDDRDRRGANILPTTAQMQHDFAANSKLHPQTWIYLYS